MHFTKTIHYSRPSSHWFQIVVIHGVFWHTRGWAKLNFSNQIKDLTPLKTLTYKKTLVFKVLIFNKIPLKTLIFKALI